MTGYRQPASVFRGVPPGSRRLLRRPGPIPHRRLAALGVAVLVATAVPPIIAAAAEEECPRGGLFAYVANSGDATVSVVDVTSDTPECPPQVVKTIELVAADADGVEVSTGVAPMRVVAGPDGARVYATHGAGSLVSVINTATNTVEDTITVGGPNDVLALTGAAVSPDGTRLYVVATANATDATEPGRLYAVDTETMATVGEAVPVGSGPVDVVVHPDGARAYVAHSRGTDSDEGDPGPGTGAVSVVNTATLGVDATIEVDAGPTDLAVSPDGARVYVAAQRGRPSAAILSAAATGAISVIDTLANKAAPADSIPMSGNPPTALGVSPDGRRLYVSWISLSGGSLSVIDVSTRISGTVTVGRAPADLALSPAGTRAYVVNSGDAPTGTVTVVDTTDNLKIRDGGAGTVEVGPAPTGIAVVGVAEPPHEPEPEPPPPPSLDPNSALRRVGTMWAPTVNLPSGQSQSGGDPQRWGATLSPPPLIVDHANGVAFTLGLEHRDVIGGEWRDRVYDPDDPSTTRRCGVGDNPTHEHPDEGSSAGALYVYDLRTGNVVDVMCRVQQAQYMDERQRSSKQDASVMHFLRGAGLVAEPGVGGRLVKPASAVGSVIAACTPFEGLAYRVEGGRTAEPRVRTYPQAHSDPLFDRGCPPVPTSHTAMAYYSRGSGTGQAAGEVIVLEHDGRERVVRKQSGETPSVGLFTEKLTDVRDRAHEGFLVRSYALDAESAAAPVDAEAGRAATNVELPLTWEVDLRALCPSWLDQWVARTDDAVLTYCWDHRPPGEFSYPGLSQAAQGFLVRIPLDEDGSPIPRPGTGDELVYGPEPTVDVSSGKRVLNATVRRIPTLPGRVQPYYDAPSGRVFLLTNDDVNGTALWVLDPKAERFVGVATHGAAPEDVPEGKTAVGFNPTIGRAYVLGPDGILVTDGRGEPPFTGVVHDALERDEVLHEDVTDLAAVTVEGRHLVIVPIRGKGYVVFEDTVPLPGEPLKGEPDALTTQVEERDGETVTALSGIGEAAGIHVVVAGGLPRAVNANSPGCQGVQELHEGDPNDPKDTGVPLAENVNPLIRAGKFEQAAYDGDCLADVLIATGHREGYLGFSEVESDTAAGVAAGAQSWHVPASDAATDADLRQAGACGARRSRDAATGAFDYTTHGAQGTGEAIERVLRARRNRPNDDSPELNQLAEEEWRWVPEDPNDRNSSAAAPLLDPMFGGYAQACDGVRDHLLARAGLDASGGTRGAGGQGFPARRAQCVDFGGGRFSDQTGDDEAVFSSTVACDAAVPEGAAASSTAALVLPSEERPLVVVRSATSWIAARPVLDRVVIDGRETDKVIQVTEAQAVAGGVQIGPVGIGTVRTTAVVEAGGRTGTARAALSRQWCDVTMGGETIASGCHEVGGPNDPLVQVVSDELRQAYPKLRISVPQAHTTASGGGYQAEAFKDEGLQAGDATVNDDTSSVVPALEAVLVADGPEGRNRWIVHLAGVHAEARYGITLLPKFSGFDGAFVSGSSTESTPGTRRVIPGTRRLPRASTIIEGEGFDDLASVSPLPENPIRRFLRWLPQALEDLWRLFVQHPLEFLLLFITFSLLATPGYMAYRRRTFLGVVAG